MIPIEDCWYRGGESQDEVSLPLSQALLGVEGFWFRV